MTKTLTPIGNASALVLDQELLDQLKIDMTTPLRLTIDGRRLIVEVEASAGSPDFDEVVAHTGRQNTELFRRLAK